VVCHLCISALLLWSQPSWGLPAAVTRSPRGWHAAADAAWNRATTATLSSNQQRERSRERGPSLVGSLPAATGTVPDDEADTAEPAPAQRRPADSSGNAAPQQAHVARLPASPLLLLIIAAAFSAGYAVGRGQQARALAELRELAAAEMAAQQLASQAAQQAAKLQHTASAPVVGPAPGAPQAVDGSVAADVSAPAACEQQADNAAMLGGTVSQQGQMPGGGQEAAAYDHRRRDSQSGERASAAGLDAVSGLSRSASASQRLPHPISGLVSLTDMVPGCESSLDRPGSGISMSGSVGLPAAHAAVAALPIDHEPDNFARQAEQSAEHAQQTEQSAQMHAEHDRADVSRSQITAASVVLRNDNYSSASRASASALATPDSHPDQALSAPMRHLRSGQSTADAIAGADELATAGCATEQVLCFAIALTCSSMSRSCGAPCADDATQCMQVSTCRSGPLRDRRGTRPQCWWAPWRGGCGWTWAACRRPTRSSSSASSSPPGKHFSSSRSTATRPGTLLPMGGTVASSSRSDRLSAIRQGCCL